MAEAIAIIDREGLEQLSLREVARRLGVSHQAPYRHFASRDHILAEIVARAFDGFARHLDARPKSEDPSADLKAMGEAYLDFARRHPLQYRLMFGAPLPAPTAHPRMMEKARHAFELLEQALRRQAQQFGQDAPKDLVVLDALFIWSGLHGLAAIQNVSAFATLGLPPDLTERAGAHLLARFGVALGRPARH